MTKLQLKLRMQKKTPYSVLCNLGLTQRNYLTNNSSIPRPSEWSLCRSQYEYAWGRQNTSLSIFTVPYGYTTFSHHPQWRCWHSHGSICTSSAFPVSYHQVFMALYHRLIFCRKWLAFCDSQFSVSLLLGYLPVIQSNTHWSRYGCEGICGCD